MFLILGLGARGAQAQDEEGQSLAGSMSGGEFDYVVKKGDWLATIGARYGVPTDTLARWNGLKPGARLKAGRTLRIDNRHLVPRKLSDGILINVPQRMLFFFKRSTLVAAYPVGLGRPDWPTSLGRFTVLELRENPVWHVPPSIQREMEEKGMEVETCVPPGPDNPLGRYWIGISMGSLGIHSTIAPLSVYHFQSHGCIRLHPDDAEVLFHSVAVGDPGEIMYAPVVLARLGDGRIFLEVHRDIYRRWGDPMAAVKRLAAANRLDSALDWDKIDGVVRFKEGIAREVGLARAASAAPGTK